MNKELLFNLYKTYSPSGQEKKMRRFVRKYILSTCGVDEKNCVTDAHGNLFVTKGVSDTYPCVASHLDQVQWNHSKDFMCIDADGVIIGFSKKSRSYQGLGADDKNGIYICLELLRTCDVLKAAFFVGEETGCVGSSACDLDFFKDCRFVIQPDRKGSSDLITSMCVGDVCSEEFVKALDAKTYGYKKANGTITDVGTLVERGIGISCLNLSCGYYHAHTDEEFTILSELENCLDFVRHIVLDLTDVYPFEYVSRWSKWGGDTYDFRSKWGGYSSRWDSWSGGGNYGIEQGSCDQWDDDNKWRWSEDTGYEWVDDNEDVQMQALDDDYDTMRQLLEIEPNLTFEELIGDWKGNFVCNSNKTLRDIYDDVVSEIEYDKEHASLVI